MTTEIIQESLLEKLRAEIDEADRVLIDTLLKRMNLVKIVGEYKKERGIPPLDQKRWEQVVKSRSEYAQGLGLSPELIVEIFEILHKYALQIESEIK